jgi:hypothetical protein
MMIMVQSRGLLTLLCVNTVCQGFNTGWISSVHQRSSFSIRTTTKASTASAETNDTTQKDDALLALIDERTGKPTGSSYLPIETLQRARETGSPAEKIKLDKDGTSAFVDVYEYARKIRNGEMTWEEVDKADLETVRAIFLSIYHTCI